MELALNKIKRWRGLEARVVGDRLAVTLGRVTSLVLIKA